MYQYTQNSGSASIYIHTYLCLCSSTLGSFSLTFCSLLECFCVVQLPLQISYLVIELLDIFFRLFGSCLQMESLRLIILIYSFIWHPAIYMCNSAVQLTNSHFLIPCSQLLAPRPAGTQILFCLLTFPLECIKLRLCIVPKCIKENYIIQSSKPDLGICVSQSNLYVVVEMQALSD